MLPNNLFARTSSLPSRPLLESYWVIPGRLLAGEYPGTPYSPENTRKRLDALLGNGFQTFINLTRPNELESYEELLKEQADYYSVEAECLRFSINDFGLPNRELMTGILDAIDEALEHDSRIYLHCFGGIGRTGTVVGCYLVRHGYTGQQALSQLAEWWHLVPKSIIHPRSPETQQQADFVLNW